MDNLRNNPPKCIGEDKILAIRDYKKDERKDLINGKTEKTGLPNSNVLYYELENDGWCCVRPSGTEPKIKFYFGIKAKTEEQADKKYQDNMIALKSLAD